MSNTIKYIYFSIFGVLSLLLGIILTEIFKKENFLIYSIFGLASLIFGIIKLIISRKKKEKPKVVSNSSNVKSISGITLSIRILLIVSTLALLIFIFTISPYRMEEKIVVTLIFLGNLAAMILSFIKKNNYKEKT